MSRRFLIAAGFVFLTAGDGCGGTDASVSSAGSTVAASAVPAPHTNSVLFKIHGPTGQFSGAFTVEMFATQPFSTSPSVAPSPGTSYGIARCEDSQNTPIGTLGHVCSLGAKSGGTLSANGFNFEFSISNGEPAEATVAPGPSGTFVSVLAGFNLANSDGPSLNNPAMTCAPPNDGTDVIEVCWPNLFPLPPFDTPIVEPSTTWTQKISCPQGNGTTGSMHVDRSADNTVFQAVIDDPGYAQHVFSNLYNSDPTRLPTILRMFTQDNQQLGTLDSGGNPITGTPVKMIISNLIQTKDPWNGTLSGYSVAITGFSAFVEINWGTSNPPRNVGQTTEIVGVDFNNAHKSQFAGASGGQCSGG